ncbi:endonuclease/exonuclease/phosphatase family protein [Gilvimarinus sp. DA14]|uniref:endonuclease/exonuclease/phosphatase family protein n=1 Tax=Gilvimarinus sp. DA14 TaxID=2956798 RepID=UPI0020B8B0FD|nr:endonuclease/exonuclease/phosphatase family protein [Gilvimarinus sp. DA14]UTF59949.1 endonuclease/exonuclease/phosphatase family protein [Gilvimarinus sp. DA14]
MHKRVWAGIFVGVCLLAACQNQTSEITEAGTMRIATFNVSMDATNYLPRDTKPDSTSASVLQRELEQGDNRQIKAIAEILQTVRPDIILLNEFDYSAEYKQAAALLQRHYFAQPQGAQRAIDYPYVYSAAVNTGVVFPYDLNGDGEISAPADTYGFGYYPGQYGMLLLSRYPIDTDSVRTFQTFKWRDMPGALQPLQADGAAYYSSKAWNKLRLSSKSHWDVPVQINGKTVHVLASHPTPPVFDGPEDRNGKRNHDEVRLWVDYISNSANYLYDDKGEYGGLSEQQSFVLVGDLNSSSVEGDGRREAITRLLQHPRVTDPKPASRGGAEARESNPNSAYHTAQWGMRADYVLPSSDLTVTGAGVYWPAQSDPGAALVKSRAASSDHRLVWVDIEL